MNSIIKKWIALLPLSKHGCSQWGGGQGDSFSAKYINELPLCWKLSLLSNLNIVLAHLRLTHLVMCFNLQLTGVCTCFKVGVASEKWACPLKFSSTLHAPYLLAPSPPVLKLIYAHAKYKANMILSLKHSRQRKIQDVDKRGVQTSFTCACDSELPVE